MVLVFNAALAALIQAAAPDQPRLTDRNDYDYNGRQPLTAYCPNSIYCYRILVPMLLERVPIDPELRWRGLQLLAHTATGTDRGDGERAGGLAVHRLGAAAILVRLYVHGLRPVHARSGHLPDRGARAASVDRGSLVRRRR